MDKMTIALLGQPNTGKSTLFNQLTGLNQHVGNWPGKTVEQKSGSLKHQGQDFEIIDLPGTYSLSANSEEERIARDFILKHKPDVLVALVDASQIERTFYILTEAIYTGIPVVAAMNMIDVAKAKGTSINMEKLYQKTGIRFFPMVASKNEGIADLKDYLCQMDQLKREYTPRLPAYPAEYQSNITALHQTISQTGLNSMPVEWLVVKSIENDPEIKTMLKENEKNIEPILENIPDGMLLSADIRFDWIQKIIRAAVQYDQKKQQVVYGFDKLATHPIAGPIIGILSMVLTLVIAFTISGPVMFAAMGAIPLLSALSRDLLQNSPQWLTAVVSSGIIPGVLFPLSMVFFMMGLYFVIGFLEDIGYMARLAYINDSLMCKMGMHGKSFMPMFLSFMCNVSGVVGTRVLESSRQRLLTIVISLLVPCVAIWGVTGFISALFFGQMGFLIVIALFVTMLLYMFLTSFVIRGTVLKGKSKGLIMELPPYHRPNWKTIWRFTYSHSLNFAKKAGVFMMIVVILLWIVSYFPGGNINDSYLAYIGRFIEPIGRLMGMDWKLVTCLMVGFISKEAVIACMAILMNLSGSQGISVVDVMTKGFVFDAGSVGNFLLDHISPSTAIAFIFALFFSIPCQATAFTIYSETRSLKWTSGIVAYFIASSFIMGIAAYQISNLFL